MEIFLGWPKKLLEELEKEVARQKKQIHKLNKEKYEVVKDLSRLKEGLVEFLENEIKNSQVDYDHGVEYNNGKIEAYKQVLSKIEGETSGNR